MIVLMQIDLNVSTEFVYVHNKRPWYTSMIIFTGGSWAVGEWQYHQLSGPGIGHYFSRSGEPVLNLSCSSIGNTAQIQRVQDLLTRYTPSETDRFYWLVHSPLVDIPIEEIYQGQTSLIESITNILHTQLAFANDVATQSGVTIYTVGASCDLDTVDISQYLHLRIAVPSWGKLLDPSFPASIFSHQTDRLPELKKLLQQNRPDLLEEFDTISGQAFGKRRAMMMAKELFHSFHPTSLAHERLSSHLAHVHIQ